MASNDPEFERKAADIIGLYVNPPPHAAVFCVNEKTAIQALDRKDPVLPLSPGRAERHGFEYYRHGTLSLYAAFNTETGEVLGRTAARHTSAEFVAFLADIVVNQPAAKEIHVIADNPSAHKTKQVTEFLDRHPNVHLHFTPTYSSWLNQVELWFARIERDVIARGVFTSVPDLRRKLVRYIRQYIKAPKTCSRPRRAILHPAVASHQCIAPDVVHRHRFLRLSSHLGGLTLIPTRRPYWAEFCRIRASRSVDARVTSFGRRNGGWMGRSVAQATAISHAIGEDVAEVAVAVG